jgi:hypothetical protein
MSWDGTERRSGLERRCNDRRSSVNFSISMILNGSASRRAGSDRRNHIRRAGDRIKAQPLPESNSPQLFKRMGSL